MFLEQSIEIHPGQKVDIPTGIAISIVSRNKNPTNPSIEGLGLVRIPGPTFSRVGALLMPRSGLGSRGLVLRNTIGLIDEDYQGEIQARCVNQGTEIIRLIRGERAFQLMFIPVYAPFVFEVVEEFTAMTERGVEGFGSTGQ